MIIPYLDDAATQEEASLAYIAVADRLLDGPDASKLAPKMLETLEKLAQITTNSTLVRRAKASLRQAKNKAGSK